MLGRSNGWQSGLLVGLGIIYLQIVTYLEVHFLKNGGLFGGTIPSDNGLLIGTVPPNSSLFGGTVPPNNGLFGGTVPPNSGFFGGTVPPNSFSHNIMSL